MTALNKRHLALAAILAATLAAAWFAPDESDEDDSVMRQPAGARGSASGTPGEPAASPAADGAPQSAEDLRLAEDRRQRALAALDVDIVRQRGGGGEAADAFASRSWYVAPPPPPPLPLPVIEVAPPPVVVPPPKAPPLPFKHVGRMLEAGRATPVHYLMEGDRMLIVTDGDLIGGKYRFVGQIGNQLQFIYLPLDVRQNLPIAGAP